MTDFLLQDEGSIFLLTPLTDAASCWVTEHVDPDALAWAGGIVVEHRFIEEIVAGAICDGLQVSTRCSS